MQFGLIDGASLYTGSTASFRGINRRRKGGRGEFEDMYNMSSDEYPCLAPRQPREKVFEPPGEILVAAAPSSGNVSAMSGFTGIANERFYYNGDEKKGAVFSSEYKWQLERMGNLYLINGFRQRGSDYSSVMYAYNTDTGKLTETGTIMDNLIVTAGSDTKGNYLATFRYGFDEVYNYSVQDIYGNEIKNSDFYDQYGSGRQLTSLNIFEKVFEKGDEVTIRGFPNDDENTGQVWSHAAGELIPQENQDFSYNNTVDIDLVKDINEINEVEIVSAVVSGFDVKRLSYNGSYIYVHYIYFELKNKNEESISFDEMESNGTAFYCSGVRLSKRIRVFDHIAVHHGRIWGSLPTGNAVYASASDDIFSFSSEDITKKYAARLTSDTEGSFTGFAEYNDELYAFKENSISIIYGSNAANYAVSVLRGIGCIDGSSAAVTPAGVIFLSHNGFYIYSGGAPQCISVNLNKKYISACGGFDGNRYYASALTETGERELLVYDTRYGLWHKEDDFESIGFFTFRSGFYMADKNFVYKVGEGAEQVEWRAVSVKSYDNMLDNKGINEIWIWAEVPEGGWFSVSTSCGGDEFIEHSTFSKSGMHVFRCPVRLIQGTEFRYKLQGAGKVVFYDIELVKSIGGRKFREY